jgi:hypothetical protein
LLTAMGLCCYYSRTASKRHFEIEGQGQEHDPK